MSNEYTPSFAKLARRAALLGCYIDIKEVDVWDPNTAGPYVLRCAETGYDAHRDGCNLAIIELAIEQIEVEQQLADRMRPLWRKGISRERAVEQVLSEIRPERRADLERKFNLRFMVDEAFINTLS